MYITILVAGIRVKIEMNAGLVDDVMTHGYYLLKALSYSGRLIPEKLQL